MRYFHVRCSFLLLDREGLHNYVKSVSEIASDVFEVMKKKSEEALEEAKEDGYGQ